MTVKRWERGSQQPSPYFRLKLCALFEKSAEELGLVETAERPAVEEAGEKDEPVLLPPASPEPQPETWPLLSLSRIRPHRSPQLLGVGLFGIALVAVVIVYSLHLLLPAHTTLPARIHAVTAIPTPTPFGQSWPQTLNDSLMANDYDPAWAVTPNAPATPGPIFGICDFSPISHTYQLQTFGANYCNYGSGYEHAWTDLAYSVELSIRQGTWGGLVIRLHQGKYYYFNISTKGTYDLLVHSGGSDKDIATGSSATIRQGLNQWNTLLIAAQGSSFQLWINGQYVTSAIDHTTSTGTIGVEASYGLGHGEPVTVVWFRHAQVWRPAGSS